MARGGGVKQKITFNDEGGEGVEQKIISNDEGGRVRTP